MSCRRSSICRFLTQLILSKQISVDLKPPLGGAQLIGSRVINRGTPESLPPTIVSADLGDIFHRRPRETSLTQTQSSADLEVPRTPTADEKERFRAPKVRALHRQPTAVCLSLDSPSRISCLFLVLKCKL